MLISGAKVKVTVGGQVFEIPQEKAQQLMMMLQSWQAISIPEQNSSMQNTRFNGQSIILG
jgi:hypothetical protein